MSSFCARDSFVSPIDHDVESEGSVQGGDIEQPLGQGGVPENLDVESADSSDDDNNEAVSVNAAPKPIIPAKQPNSDMYEHIWKHSP